MQQSNKESLVSRPIVVLYRWVVALVAVGVAAGCAFAPTGDPQRDQARAIAAAGTAEVAEEAQKAEKAQEEEDAAEHENARED